MRFPPFAFVVSVALVSCGGGSSAPSLPVQRHAVTLPPASGTWSSSLGPWNAQDSGKLNAVAIDPNDANTIYVGGGVGSADGVTTDAGVFKTTDGGASWSAADSGLSDTTIDTLAIDPNTGSILAGTENGGIFRSTDGAQDWTNVDNASGVRDIVPAGGVWYAASSGGILSSNDGVSWTLAASTRTAVDTIAVAGNGIVYAGLVDGSIVRLQHGTLAYLSMLPPTGAPPVVHAIVIDPATPSSIYASLTAVLDGIYSDALFHSTDGGRTWAQCSLPTSLRGAQAMAFSSIVPHRLYVAGVGIAYTQDGVTFAQAPGYGDARSLTVLANDRLAIAGDQGLAFGTYGTAFAPVTAGLPINIVRSVARSGSTLLVTMQDFPPARSVDGGSTWQTLAIGSNENGTAYINPNAPNLCYVLDAGIDVSTDGCTTFSSQQIGDRLESTEPMATAPNSTLTYALTQSGAYVASDGANFVAAHWAVPGPVDVATDPNNANDVYASSVSGGVRVWRSHDGGQTFAPSAVLTPPGPSYPNDAPVIAVDPMNSNVVIAVTQTAIYRSADGGATFTALHETYVSTQLQQRDPDVRETSSATSGYNIAEHIAFVSTGGESLLLVDNSGGLYGSNDDGTTLRPLSTGAVSHVFEGFANDGDGRVCAGTDGEGVVCADAAALASAAN